MTRPRSLIFYRWRRKAVLEGDGDVFGEQERKGRVFI